MHPNRNAWVSLLLGSLALAGCAGTANPTAPSHAPAAAAKAPRFGLLSVPPNHGIETLTVLDDTHVISGGGPYTVQFSSQTSSWRPNRTTIGLYDAQATSDPNSGGNEITGVIHSYQFYSQYQGWVMVDATNLPAGDYWLRTLTQLGPGGNNWEVVEGILKVH